VSRPQDSAPIAPRETDAVRRPFRAASLLPGRAYHAPEVYELERSRWFGSDWQCVGRAEDAAGPGAYFLAEVDGEPLIVVRGREWELRAFYNVCRHRGTAVVEESSGQAVRFQCPYHAWIYDLDGRLIRAKHTEDLDEFSLEGFGLARVRLDTWQGFVFVSLVAAGPTLVQQLGDLVDRFARFDFAALRVAHTETYEVAANWKLIGENYSECYHCPGVHPQLNRLTPYDLGGDFDSHGAWHGGWMELATDAETMALDGGHRDGRPVMAGITPVDERRIYYFLVWPTLFLSVHPDYLLAHRLAPAGPDRTGITCEWLFEPATIAAPGFDPSDAVAFWDLTNRQDWHVCELQHRGTASRSWIAGRYSNQEASVHAFDLMVADRYADDGVTSARTVRERYDTPPPTSDHTAESSADQTAGDRSVTRTRDRAASRTRASSQR
jgi:phenylpropionate dioxygenase-like ring-hydroxylating dioxygenase large terminal subunit